MPSRRIMPNIIWRLSRERSFNHLIESRFVAARAPKALQRRQRGRGRSNYLKIRFFRPTTPRESLSLFLVSLNLPLLLFARAAAAGVPIAVCSDAPVTFFSPASYFLVLFTSRSCVHLSREDGKMEVGKRGAEGVSGMNLRHSRGIQLW